MSRAVIETSGRVRQLDKPAEADERVTPEDVQNPEILARLLTRLVKFITGLLRLWRPRTLDFDRVTTTGTSISPQTVRFPHGFGGRVRYWPIGWESAGGVALAIIERTDQTDTNTLVLYVYSAGVLSLRVEEAG